MRVEEFDYTLPRELIAQHPSGDRTASRLLVYDRARGTVGHHRFSDIPGYLREGDVLVLNDSKVFPARLKARKKTGGLLDVLLVRPLGEGAWECLVRGVGRGKSEVSVAVGDYSASLGRSGASWTIAFDSAKSSGEALKKHGKMPLPPYIKRNGADNGADFERYQTVYAEKTGSIAAPTAGFHFSREILEQIGSKGVDIIRITLHIGTGTFALIHSDEVEEHRMHGESYELDEASRALIANARAAGRRIVACGTSAVRTLETVFSEGGNGSLSGKTELFIYPGYHFRVVGALITNFHLPRSTPLMLAAAFMGREGLQSAYREAINEGYRFYSYGDAMFIA